MAATQQRQKEIASGSSRPTFEAIEARIEALRHEAGGDARGNVAELLNLCEHVLEYWIEARGEIPTTETKEGFRLLALHRQGAKGEPSFNACRESCRELVYHYNLVMTDPDHSETTQRVLLATFVASHICLFISGKMQVAGIGEFCCAAKPLRLGEHDSTRQSAIVEN